jgi:PAS domain S-box-containing protein
MRENKRNTTLAAESWLSELRSGDYAGFAAQLAPLKRMSYPLLNGPYCLDHLVRPSNYPAHSEEDRMLRLLTHHFNWRLNPDHILCETFDAIVITDLRQEIVWASDGFRKMTGYAPDYATGRTPSFLQGPETSEATKALIREHLREQRAVSAVVVNYKQNGETYLCRVAIQPVRNLSREVTHFLALETAL